jgi:hypothetical protein
MLFCIAPHAITSTFKKPGTIAGLLFVLGGAALSLPALRESQSAYP